MNRRDLLKFAAAGAASLTLHSVSHGSQVAPHPTWDAVLNRLGFHLDRRVYWNRTCQQLGVRTGGDYLRYWIAATILHRDIYVPYLYLYGPQATGKSLFHEAITLLMPRWNTVRRCDRLLSSTSMWNTAFTDMRVGVIEGTDFNHDEEAARRIVEWAFAAEVTIHGPMKESYSIPNRTAWVHCSNSAESGIDPVHGAITTVKTFPLEHTIPKPTLLTSLMTEAGEFIHDLPGVCDRPLLPALE